MIDPITTNTARVGELPNKPFSLSDKIPHEVGIDLKSGTVQQLVDLVANVLDTAGGVGFRAISVNDGQTLPTTTTQEFILLGKGTYYNVSGGDTIILTKELNAIVSNGSFWFIGVEIDINAEDLGIVQTIRQGFIETAPSENAIYNAIEIINSALNTKENTIAQGTTDQYYRGDKTWQNISTIKIYKIGELCIFKNPTNTNASILEAGDMVTGIVQGMFINASYLGGDTTLLTSFDIVNQTEI